MIFHCPACGTELKHDGISDLWCSRCQETIPPSRIQEHDDFDGAPLGYPIDPDYEWGPMDASGKVAGDGI